MSVEIKRIVEESKSPKELLDKLDKIDHRLSDEELEMVTGGGNTGMNGCPGNVPSSLCWGCSYFSKNNVAPILYCGLSGFTSIIGSGSDVSI